MAFVVRVTLCLVLASCEAKPPNDPLAPIPVREIGRSEVRHQGVRIGEVVELELQERGGPQQFFRIEDAEFRWVGYASNLGHFYRLAPFQEREQFIGMFPMAEGVGHLLETDGTVEVVRLKHEEGLRRAAEAAARRRPIEAVRSGSGGATTR